MTKVVGYVHAFCINNSLKLTVVYGDIKPRRKVFTEVEEAAFSLVNISWANEMTVSHTSGNDKRHVTGKLGTGRSILSDG